MARPRGAKDRAPRRKRMSHMQKTQLAIAGALGTIGLGTAAIVANSQRQMGKWEKDRAGLRKRTDDMISEAQRKASAPPPKASGYKGLSRAQKSAKVKARIAAMGLTGSSPLTGVNSQLARRMRGTIAKAASVMARRKLGLKYRSGSVLALFLMGDYTAEFRRGKDKKPRKSRKKDWDAVPKRVIASGLSLVGGAAGLAGGTVARRVLNNKMKPSMPGASRSVLNEARRELWENTGGVSARLKARPRVAGALAGQVLLPAAYGAYLLAKKNRRKRQ